MDPQESLVHRQRSAPVDRRRRTVLGIVGGATISLVTGATIAFAAPPSASGPTDATVVAAVDPSAATTADATATPEASSTPPATATDPAKGDTDAATHCMGGTHLGQISITAIAGSDLTLGTEDGWTRTITVSDGTTYSKDGTTITLSDLAVGDTIRFGQTRNDDGTYAITSVTVVQPRIGGTVTGVASDSITVKRQDGTTATINVTADTTYTLQGVTDATLADVKVGDRISASGNKVDDTTLDATSITTGHGPAMAAILLAATAVAAVRVSTTAPPRTADASRSPLPPRSTERRATSPPLLRVRRGAGGAGRLPGARPSSLSGGPRGIREGGRELGEAANGRIPRWQSERQPVRVRPSPRWLDAQTASRLEPEPRVVPGVPQETQHRLAARRRDVDRRAHQRTSDAPSLPLGHDGDRPDHPDATHEPRIAADQVALTEQEVTDQRADRLLDDHGSAADPAVGTAHTVHDRAFDRPPERCFVDRPDRLRIAGQLGPDRQVHSIPALMTATATPAVAMWSSVAHEPFTGPARRPRSPPSSVGPAAPPPRPSSRQACPPRRPPRARDPRPLSPQHP